MKLTHITRFYRVCFRLAHSYFQMIYGYWKISRLPEPVVSIFGGSRLPVNDPYMIQAAELSTKLLNINISVLTGGGPGIMQAANCGITANKSKQAKSIGIGVSELGQGRNTCVEEYFELRYFFARKWLLTRHSVGFVVFPGGFGTLDEFAEILTLIQTKKMAAYPLILVGIEYWNPLVAWLETEALRHGTITKEQLNLFILTDDLDVVLCTLQNKCLINS